MRQTNDLLQTWHMLHATTELTELTKRKNAVSKNILPTSTSFQLLGQIRHREVSLFLAYFKALRLRRTGDGPATQANERNKANS